MRFADFLTGKKLIEKRISSINGEIRIVKLLGKYSLEIGGLEQSGSFIDSIWKKALKEIQNSKLKIKNCLILGLGGGTAAKLAAKFWPEVKIIGVEIDPLIIKLAKKYFGLDKIPHLKTVNQDAVEFISRQPLTTGRYSLILVDVYLGDQVPRSCETEDFLIKIKQLLSSGGIAIFNRLFYKEKKKQAERFIGRLRKIFPDIYFIRTPSNLLILSQGRYN